MSTLTEALEIISAWSQKHFPDSQLLKPGLSSEAIQKEVSDLPFELPTEINELYLWRNGGVIYHYFLPCPEEENRYEEIYTFFSLEEAVAITKDWDNGWLPLFQTDGSIFWIIGPKQKQRTSSIFYNDEDVLPNEPRYESLTSMMLEISESLRG